MSQLASVLTFVTTYALGSELVNRVAVYYLHFWDPKFGSPAGNVTVFHQVLPIFVGVATLSFLAGLSFHRSWLTQAPLLPVLLGGALSGLIASSALLIVAAVRFWTGWTGVAHLVGTLAFWAGPGVAGALMFTVLREHCSPTT